MTEERNRIAREIHDTLAQSLTGIEIQLDSATEMLAKDPTGARAEIASASQLAHQSLEEARRTIWELHPPTLVSGSLVEAVRAEVAKTCDEGIKWSLEVVGEEPIAMDPAAELTILRIVQESLANVCSHSRATEAVVQIEFGASEANLLIRDDGRGFDTSAPSGVLSPTCGGFGLTNMRERSRLVGGRVQVRSTPGEGAVVEASVPYVSSAKGRIPSRSWPAAKDPISERASKGGSLVQLAHDEDMLVQLPAATSPRLTERELDVLRLLSLGERNKEIAEQLEVSVNTIKSHVENIYFKLGAHTRTQAVRYARGHGLIGT